MKTKVSLVRCGSYRPDDVKRAVTRAVDLLGGMGSFVEENQRVLLKPNLLSPKPPENAVTTHPSVVGAVVGLAKGRGASVAIGDSPGFFKFSKVVASSGIEEVAERTGARLAPFDSAVEVSQMRETALKKIPLAREATDADVIVSIPKFKTHCLTHITGAIKNMLGCVPGLIKSEFHYRFPENESFSRMLVELNLTLRADLHIMDAIVGMDGNGPGAGDPFPINLIIAGADPVAIDSTACRVVGIDPESVPMIRIGGELSLGVSSQSDIEILGEDIRSVTVDGFRPIIPKWGPSRLLPIPPLLIERFRNWVVRRPRCVSSQCIECGACVTVCPSRAMKIEDGRVSVDDSKCILCYCCSEVCPQKAMELKRGLGAELLAKLLKIG